METDMWAINILNENDGLIDITIPSDIKAGDYILRGEILALHLADQGIFEVYSNCVHLTVSGGGDVVPEGIDLKEMYGDTEGNPGLLWDLYDGEKKEYPIPGPKVYQPGSGSSGTNNNTPSNEGSAKNTSKDLSEEVEKDKTEEVEKDVSEEVEKDVTEEVEEDVQTSKKSEKTQNRGKNRNSSSIEDQSETEDNNKPTDTSSSDDPESSTTSFSSIRLNNKLQRPPCNNVRKRRIK
ncbi:hypothetical protein GGI05_002695 [Coemansia sp. RSA 2603]|nr:hypothetical protein GGI05_002695 [Coemansia sp. RSA 2603]